MTDYHDAQPERPIRLEAVLLLYLQSGPDDDNIILIIEAVRMSVHGDRQLVLPWLDQTDAA